MYNQIKRVLFNIFGTVIIVAATIGGIYVMETNKLPNLQSFIAGTEQVKQYANTLAQNITKKKTPTPSPTVTPSDTPIPTITNTPTPSPYLTPTLMPAYPYTPEQLTLASDSANVNDYAKYGNFEVGFLKFETLIPKNWTAVEGNRFNRIPISFGPPQTEQQGYITNFYGHMSLTIISKRDVSTSDVTKWTNKDQKFFDGSPLSMWTDITVNGKPAKRIMLTQRMKVDTVVVVEGDNIIIFSNYYKDEDAIFKNLIVNFKMTNSRM